MLIKCCILSYLYLFWQLQPHFPNGGRHHFSFFIMLWVERLIWERSLDWDRYDGELPWHRSTATSQSANRSRTAGGCVFNSQTQCGTPGHIQVQLPVAAQAYMSQNIFDESITVCLCVCACVCACACVCVCLYACVSCGCVYVCLGETICACLCVFCLLCL